MGDDEKFEDFYANAERRIRELNKKRDDAMNETPQKIYAKIGELIGTLNLDGEEYPVKGLSDKTAQLLHRTVCPNCGAPHSPWEAKCEYCGGYVDVEMNQIEIKPQTGDYSFIRWDGERWIQTPARLLDRIYAERISEEDIVGYKEETL